MVTSGEGRREGGKDWEFGISRCKLVYIEWINKVLLYIVQASQVAQWERSHLPMQETQGETWVQSHFVILAWKIPRIGEPGGLQSKGSQTVGRN